MKAFKNYSGPGGGSGAGGSGAGGFHGPGAAQILVLRVVKGALINSLARVINSSGGLLDQSKAA